jgi:hypothetical protein
MNKQSKKIVLISIVFFCERLKRVVRLRRDQLIFDIEENEPIIKFQCLCGKLHCVT